MENTEDLLFKRVVTFVFGVINAVALFMGLWGLTVPDLVAPASTSSVSSPDFRTALLIGVLAAGCHALLWSAAERVFGWRFGAGERDELPQGFAAVVLSLTVSLPLVLVPVFFASAVREPILRAHHWGGAAAAVVACATAHILIYGVRATHFPGFRELLRHQFRSDLAFELVVLAVYSACLGGLTTVSYWAGSDSIAIVVTTPIIARVLLASAVPFFGGAALILLKYPDSIRDRAWIAVRGVIVGLVLVVGLTLGMYYL